MKKMNCRQWTKEFNSLCAKGPYYTDKEIMIMIDKYEKKMYEDRLKAAGITLTKRGIKQQEPK